MLKVKWAREYNLHEHNDSLQLRSKVVRYADILPLLREARKFAQYVDDRAELRSTIRVEAEAFLDATKGVEG